MQATIGITNLKGRTRKGELPHGGLNAASSRAYTPEILIRRGIGYGIHRFFLQPPFLKTFFNQIILTVSSSSSQEEWSRNGRRYEGVLFSTVTISLYSSHHRLFRYCQHS